MKPTPKSFSSSSVITLFSQASHLMFSLMNRIIYEQTVAIERSMPGMSSADHAKLSALSFRKKGYYSIPLDLVFLRNQNPTLMGTDTNFGMHKGLVHLNQENPKAKKSIEKSKREREKRLLIVTCKPVRCICVSLRKA